MALAHVRVRVLRWRSTHALLCAQGAAGLADPPTYAACFAHVPVRVRHREEVCFRSRGIERTPHRFQRDATMRSKLSSQDPIRKYKTSHRETTRWTVRVRAPRIALDLSFAQVEAELVTLRRLSTPSSVFEQYHARIHGIGLSDGTCARLRRPCRAPAIHARRSPRASQRCCPP